MAMPASDDGGKVTVRVDAELRARLAAEAAQDRRPVASMAKLLIEDALAARASGRVFMGQSTISQHRDAVTAAEVTRRMPWPLLG